jgi:hypothetical protein
MRLTDDLKEAKRLIHIAMYEQERADDSRCASSGKRYWGPKPSRRGIVTVAKGK